MANLKFYRGAEPKSPAAGYIWFDSTNKAIKVYTGEAWEPYYGLADASYEKGLLTITKPDGTTVSVDLSDMASAKTLAELKTAFEACDLTEVGTEGSFISSVSQTDGKVSASATAFADTVAANGSVAPKASAVATYVKGEIEKLDSTNNVSKESHGVKVQVDEIDGKVSTPIITITPGSVAENNDSVVTGGAVYTAVESAKSDLQSAINTAVGSVYKVKGTVTSYEDLEKITNPTVGDVYNVTAANGNVPAGTNYVWVGEEGDVAAHWDALGGTVDLSPYAKTADLSYTDTAEAKKLVSAVSESNGIITVTRRELVADDIPTLNISKISGLDDALVTSFAGNTGAITVTSNSTTAWDVNFTISDNKVVSGKVVAPKLDDAYKKLQAAVSVTGSEAQTITAISQNDQGIISVTTADIAINQSQVDGLESTLKGKMSADATAADIPMSNTDKTTISAAIADAKKAGTDASSAVNNLNGGGTSESVKGVTVKVTQSAGKVDTPIVTIADGTVGGASDENLVTGAIVKTYVDSAIKASDTMSWAAFE